MESREIARHCSISGDIEAGSGGVYFGYHQGLGDDEANLFDSTRGMRGVGAFELDGEEGAVELPPIWEDEFGEEDTAGLRKRVRSSLQSTANHLS